MCELSIPKQAKVIQANSDNPYIRVPTHRHVLSILKLVFKNLHVCHNKVLPRGCKLGIFRMELRALKNIYALIAIKNPKGYGHFFLVSNFHVWTENMGSLNFETDSQKSLSTKSFRLAL